MLKCKPILPRERAENLHMEVLEQTDALRASLLSSVSHDLRTPLSAIKTSATSLRQDELYRDPDALLDLAMNIEREADRLNRLVENLLDMSRIEGGVLSPEKVWYPLDELLHDVLSRMEAQHPAHPRFLQTIAGVGYRFSDL